MHEKQPIPTLLSPVDCARILGLTPESIRRLIRSGRLPAHRLSRKTQRVDEQDLRKYIERAALTGGGHV
jgi:excisionase family DNA binding protein